MIIVIMVCIYTSAAFMSGYENNELKLGLKPHSRGLCLDVATHSFIIY